MSIRELKSAIGALREKLGSVGAAKKIGITPVSVQMFLAGGEVYAKTLAKLQKAAGMPVTAVPAREKVKLAAKERKAKKAEKRAAKADKKAPKKVKTKKARTKVKAKPAKLAKARKPKRKAKPVAKAAAKSKKAKSKKKAPARKKSKKPGKHMNGAAGHAKAVATEEAEEALQAAVAGGEA
jgi:hypothetical protein